MAPRTRPVSERFSEKVKIEDGCHVWQSGRSPGGYGWFWVNAVAGDVPAHRWAYEQVHGPIPDGLLVLHSCDNPPCVNVAHLRLGTQADNMADRSARKRDKESRKTHCKHGHEFSEENISITSAGHRLCLTCHRERQRSYRAKF